MKYQTTFLTILFFSLSPTVLSPTTPPEPDESSLYGHYSEGDEFADHEATLIGGAPLAEYLLLHQELGYLFRGLYGDAHPLQHYLDTIQHLTYSYTQSRKRWIARRSFSRSSAEETSDLAQTLNEIKQHGAALLNNFRVDKVNNDGETTENGLPSDQEWQQLDPQQQTQQPTVTVTPTTPQNKQDESFKAFFGAMQNAQTQHPGLMEYKDQQRQQVYIFLVGLAVIGIAYYLIRRTATPLYNQLGVVHAKGMADFTNAETTVKGLTEKVNSFLDSTRGRK